MDGDPWGAAAGAGGLERVGDQALPGMDGEGGREAFSWRAGQWGNSPPPRHMGGVEPFGPILGTALGCRTPRAAGRCRASGKRMAGEARIPSVGWDFGGWGWGGRRVAGTARVRSTMRYFYPTQHQIFTQLSFQVFYSKHSFIMWGAGRFPRG